MVNGALATVVITKQRLARLVNVGNTKCAFCKREMVRDEEMIKKKVKNGNHKFYHEECYERIYL